MFLFRFLLIIFSVLQTEAYSRDDGGLVVRGGK